MSTNNPIYRYPGTQPFTREQADIFFGREDTIRDLQEYVQLHTITVLYSKSGLGKSSLLNAGLRPELDKDQNLKTVYIRFKAHAENQEATPVYTTRRNIVSGEFQETYLDTIIYNEPSFWHDVKEQQIIKGDSQELVLIFDQFEELFSYPQAQIDAFKEELTELLYTKVPKRYRDIIRQQQEDGTLKLSQEELETIYQTNSIKIILGIRSDKMHLLNNLADHIPTILANCFELSPLNRTQAQDAIHNPALSRLNFFESNRFEYTSEAANKIIRFLSKNNTKPIESFQLQIICHAIEEKVIEKGLKEVTADDIGDLEMLIENYYVDQLATIEKEKEREKAQRLIEDGLIFESEQRRVSLYQGQIMKDYGVNDTLLEKLIASRLIRSEALPDGGYVYELSHDSLVAPVLKVKQNRKVEEEKLALAKEAEEAQQREQKAKEEQAKTRSRNIFTSVLATLAVISFFFAWWKYQEAEKVKNLLGDDFITESVDYKIKTLNYPAAYYDLEGAAKYLNKDLVIARLLEIAFLYNEANQLDSAASVMNTLNEVVSGPNINTSSRENIRKVINTLSEKYAINDKTLSKRYLVDLSTPIPVGKNQVAFNTTETTVWQYYTYCLSEGLDISLTASNWDLSGDYPVVKVDWYEAISYANWLSEKMGLEPVYQIQKPSNAAVNVEEDTTKDQWVVNRDSSANGFRLSTFKEWHTAAAYGQERLDTLPYTISGVTEILESDTGEISDIDYTLGAYMWYVKNSIVGSLYEPRPVATRLPNQLGLYDMSGNVWEWCEDDDFYDGVSEKLKVVAGGGFNYEAYDCTVNSKDNNYAYYRNRSDGNTNGIRLCRTITKAQ